VGGVVCAIASASLSAAHLVVRCQRFATAIMSASDHLACSSPNEPEGSIRTRDADHEQNCSVPGICSFITACNQNQEHGD
jgi:hypothetical protein